MKYLLVLGIGILALASLVVFTQQDTVPNELQTTPQNVSQYPSAIFAGGCFWCNEAAFESVPGVIEVYSGYTAGNEEQYPSPTYTQVSTGTTGYYEAVQVYYDPSQVTYEELLEEFWTQIDPLDDGGQFVDRGSQYKTAIFYANDDQYKAIQKSRKAIEEQLGQPVKTLVLEEQTFFLAEEYHQDYAKKKYDSYKRYADNSGRNERLGELWQETAYVKPSDEELKGQLTQLQYIVTQKEGTEKPFENAYWDHYEEGIYVDVVTGQPLFSSKDKYDSGTGWPSFTKPIDDSAIETTKDFKLGIPRTEVRSALGDNHLGHVFSDGPKDSTGLRFCMNSAALKFIPKSELEAQEYGEYTYLFT